MWLDKLPWRTGAALIAAALLGKKRAFREDAQTCTRLMRPALQVFESEHIPPSGPYLLTINHYTRPGLGAWWLALATSATLPVEVHWIVAETWTYPDAVRARLLTPLTRWAFRRVEAVYGFTSMPPMPPRPQDTLGRARAVRQVLEYARSTPQAVIGLAPEGRDSPGAVLCQPPPGVGRFVLHLAQQGLPILPVGAYEAEGWYCLRFGAPYNLPPADSLAPEERDRLASQVVMAHIAGLLPQHLRGDFVFV